MAKIAHKNEKTTAFGGINFVLDKYDALLREVIGYKNIFADFGCFALGFHYLCIQNKCIDYESKNSDHVGRHCCSPL
ncbi:MAG: hypothetical protein IKH88_11210 [Prevotella sp.]|nr:hypothetical protein [Prevotella sp.]